MAIPKLLFANNAVAPLGSTVYPNDTTIIISSGYENLFPVPDYPNNFYKITLENSQDNIIEICEVTNRSQNNLTVLRGREGTNASTFVASKTSIQLRVTADTLDRFLQETDVLTAGEYLKVATDGTITSDLPVVISALSPSSPTQGMQWLRTTDNTFWLWKNSEWVNIGSNTQGPKGDKGDKGDIGSTGPAGPPGTIGAASTIPGPVGPSGTIGAAGAAGPPGSQWLTGNGSPGNNLGVDGDIYHDNQNNDLYQKASGSWSYFTNIKGDPGTGDSISDHSELTGLGAADAHPIDSITGLRSVLNSKIRNYFQSNTPTGGTYYDGYMWYDSNDYNLPYRFDGVSTWVAIPPVRALSSGQIGTDGIQDGAVTVDKLASSSVDTGNIVPGAIDATKFASTVKPVEIVTSLPALPDAAYPQGAVVFLTTDELLYRNTNGSTWTNSIPAASVTGTIVSGQIADGAITTAKIAQQIQAIEVVSTLPALPDSNYGVGAVVYYTADNKLYRSNSLQWTAAIPAADITGEIVSAQLADASVTTAKFASGLNAVRLVNSLPTLPDSNYPRGTVAFLTTDEKLYRNLDNVSWSASVDSVDVTGQLTDSQIAQLSTAKLTGFIQTTQISDNAVTTSKIAAGAVTTNELAANSVLAGNIAAEAVTAVEIAAGSVTSSKLASNSVTTDKLVAQSITSAKIQAGAINTTELAAGAVSTDKLAALSITSEKIAAGAVSATKILSNSITSTQISAGAITSSELATDSVIAGKIAAGVVSAAEIAAGAVSTVKLAANAVTTDKIAANAITSAQINAGAITSSELASNSVVAGKIQAGAISANELATGAITSGKIQAGAITADKIGANQVTADKISVSKLVSASDVSTLFGQDSTSTRVEIEGSGSYPLWYGTGAKNDVNAKFYLKSDGTLKYTGGGSSDQVSTYRAHLRNIYPFYRVIPYTSDLPDVVNGPTGSGQDCPPFAHAEDHASIYPAQDIGATYSWPVVFGQNKCSLFSPLETTYTGGIYDTQRLANKATPILIFANYIGDAGRVLLYLQYRYDSGGWNTIRFINYDQSFRLGNTFIEWFTPVSASWNEKIDFRFYMIDQGGGPKWQQFDLQVIGLNLMGA